MKPIIFTLILCILVTFSFAQNASSKKTASQSAIIINVPDLADPASKKWHEAYSDYIKKALIAIRNNDENAWKKTIPEAKRLSEVKQTWLGKHNADSEKLKAWNMQLMPYIQELMNSDFYKKMD